ncbi:hypothetical protein CcCBS67573_g06432 [Chytriomyces confervae]|uniref:Extracellular membrane protein CFEM domain-containing protein n=1 Tax=Chytriomyces confervae TaxID=246404 RepID=A0A507F397_9FUNG|nr:hypothetical protein CcCBS67573_g06432 [Chytriomyces confervae]
MNSAVTLLASALLLAVMVSAQAPFSAAINFPSLCSVQCADFGSALTSKCVTAATTVPETSQKIGLCFCKQYATSKGADCLTCIGNSYPDKPSTDLFKALGNGCSVDVTGVQTGLAIAGVIRDAVLQNAVEATTMTTTTTGMSFTTVLLGSTTTATAATTDGVKNGAAVKSASLLSQGVESVSAVTLSGPSKSAGSVVSVGNAVVAVVVVCAVLLL